MGIGIANTEARLQTIFGGRQRFELTNDHGLSVSVSLPMSLLTVTVKVPS
jgi:sensor histidine kinase YesM